MLEAMTYRFRGHSVADAGLAYRTKDEIARAPARTTRSCACASAAARARASPTSELDAIDARADERVAAAVQFADCERRSRASTSSPAGMHAAGSAEQFDAHAPGQRRSARRR